VTPAAPDVGEPAAPVVDKLVSTSLARAKLGAFDLFMAVLAALAVMVVISLVVPLGILTIDTSGFPAVMAFTMLVLWLFTRGFGAMGRHVPSAGPFFAYIASGLGKPLGVGAALVSLAAYTGFQVSSYGGLGPAVSELLNMAFGIDIVWWVPALMACLLIAVLGCFNLKKIMMVLTVLAVVEIVLVVALLAAITIMPSFAWSWQSLSPAHLVSPKAAATFLACLTSCVGIEHINTYVLETRRPEKTAPRATAISIVAMLVLYAGGALVLTSAITAQTAGPDLFLNAASSVLGKAALTGALVMLSTGLLAGGLAFHNVIARGTFSLAKDFAPDDGLAAVFGRLAANGVPRAASMLQSAVGLTVIVMAAYFQWKPKDQLFFWGSVAGGLGILCLFTLTSIAVPFFFAGNHRGEKAWSRWIAPCLAFAFLAYATYLGVTTLPSAFGLTSWSGPALFTPIGYLALVVIGVVLGLWLRSYRPATYKGLGLGVTSLAVRTTAPLAARDTAEASR